MSCQCDKGHRCLTWLLEYGARVDPDTGKTVKCDLKIEVAKATRHGDTLRLITKNGWEVIQAGGQVVIRGIQEPKAGLKEDGK